VSSAFVVAERNGATESNNSLIHWVFKLNLMAFVSGTISRFGDGRGGGRPQGPFQPQPLRAGSPAADPHRTGPLHSR